MCLTYITKVLSEPDSKVRAAWKLFQRGTNGELLYLFYNDRKPIRQGDWLAAEATALTSQLNDPYLSGFHVFVTRREARAFGHMVPCTIKKVLVKDIIYHGLQDGLRCYVAQKLFVPKKGRK